MVSPVPGTEITDPPARPLRPGGALEGRPYGPALSRTPLTDQLDRIETKLDALLAALADEQAEAPEIDLDGNALPGERDQDEEL